MLTDPADQGREDYHVGHHVRGEPGKLRSDCCICMAGSVVIPYLSGGTEDRWGRQRVGIPGRCGGGSGG